MIEMLTTLEGNEFVMERLYDGAILHLDSFMQEDFIHIDLRCGKDTKLLISRREEFEQIVSANKQLEKDVLLYENNLLNKNQAYTPFDYIKLPILVTPKEVDSFNSQSKLKAKNPETVQTLS